MRSSFFSAIATVIVAVVVAVVCCAATPAAALPLNGLQLKRVHNAYHIANSVTTLSKTHHDLRFTHEALDVSLDHGARGLELDTEVDSTDGELPVFHDKNDAGTQCTSLRRCLAPVVGWSNKYATQHHALFMMIEVKSRVAPLSIRQALTAIEKRIYGALPASRIVRASDVLGARSSLREAVRLDGWPSVAATRGKLLFTVQMDEDDERDPDYNAAFGNATTVFSLGRDRVSRNSSNTVILVPRDDDVVLNTTLLAGLFAQNLILRIQVDGGLEVNATLRDAAIANGIHLLDTDFPVKSSLAHDHVQIPGGVVSRCNPRTAPAGCSDTTDVENLGFIAGPEHPSGGGYWCCVPARLHYAALLISLALLLTHAVAHCACLRGARHALSTALLLLGTTAFFAPWTIRAVTDVIVLRHKVESDDLFIMVGAFFRAIYFAAGILCIVEAAGGGAPASIFDARKGLSKLLGASDSGQWWRGAFLAVLVAAVPVIELATLIQSATTDNEVGYGSLSKRPFAVHTSLLAIVSVVLLGMVWSRRKNAQAYEATGAQLAWLAVFVCAPYVQLLVIAAIGSVYIGPHDALLSLPERVIVYHNMLYAFECVLLTLTAHKFFDNPNKTELISPSEAVALNRRDDD